MHPSCLILLLLLSFLSGQSQTLRSDAKVSDSPVAYRTPCTPATITNAFPGLASVPVHHPIGPTIYPIPPVYYSAPPPAPADTYGKHKSRWWRPVVTGFVCGVVTVLITSSLR
jgi:hypothetical protein